MRTHRVKMGAVLVGWVTSWFILSALVIAAVISLLASGLDLTSTSYAFELNKESMLFMNVAFLVVIFGTFFVGGYVTGRMAALYGMINGSMIIATSILFIFFAETFLSIVGQKLGVNLIMAVKQILTPFSLHVVIAVLLATAGSILGGRLGEGYTARLDAALLNIQKDKDEIE